jgi:hypothetical protein
MTISDVAYTVAVFENSYEVWDQEYKKKRMSWIDWEMYKESEDYTVKKPKYTNRKGKKREYCDLGWSKDGIEFYNEVRKWWRDISFTNFHGKWSNLEEAWAKYAEENDFGNIYSRKKMRLDISSNTPNYEEAQEEELPANFFVCGKKFTIVHGKKTKETSMRTMTMGVTMSMDVVDHGRELGIGATVFLE